MASDPHPTDPTGFRSEGFVEAGGGGAAGSPEPDSSIGPYRLLSVLGEGGFGIVHLAEQREPVRRRVALKVIKPGMDSRAVIARFQAERQALALMNHENIARVFDAGRTARGLPFFVMEYVRGTPITGYCDEHRLSVDERVRLFARVCQAVQHAHQKGVLHRDLKPSNILVEHTEQGPKPKIIDFGIAKALLHPLTEATIFTREGQMVGTPEYMSPEQAAGNAQIIDTRSDIYSLGVILYELLSGVRPSACETPAPASNRARRRTEYRPPSRRLASASVESELAEAISRARETPIRTLVRKVRGDLDWVVMRCLEEDRDRRYDSAAALADDLTRYLRSEPVLAGPPTTLYRLGKFVRRHRAVVLAAASIAIAMVLGLAAASYGLVHATRERDAARAAQVEAETARAEAESARAEAESVIEFLTTMLASADPTEAPHDVTVREILDDAAARIEENSLEGQPVVEARLRYTVGRAYLELGLYPEAEHHLVTSQRILAGRRPQDDYLAIRTRNDLARLRMNRGEYAAASEILAESIPQARRTLGEHHQLTLTMLNNLASVSFYQQDYERAAEAFAEMLGAFEDSIGPDHRRTLICRANLATALQAMGRHEEAAAEHRRILERRRRVLGNDHQDTMQSVFLLGSTLVGLGQLEEAEPLLREVLDFRTRTLGEEHPNTVNAAHYLGRVRLDRGDAVEAERLLTRAAERRASLLGNGHTDTLWSRYFLARALVELGRHAEAEAILRDLIPRQEEVFGPDDPNTLRSRYFLAESLMGRGRRMEAESLLRSIAEARNAPELLRGRSLGKLGSMLSRDGDAEEAEAMLLECHRVLSGAEGAQSTWARWAAGLLADHFERHHDGEAGERWRARASGDAPVAGDAAPR